MSMNVLEASGLGKRYGRGQGEDLLAAGRQASLEELALNYLRETPTEVAK